MSPGGSNIRTTGGAEEHLLQALGHGDRSELAELAAHRIYSRMLETVLETFGPGRLMAGSDWPVCLLASTYTGWFTTLHQMLHSLSAAEKGEHLRRSCIPRLSLATKGMTEDSDESTRHS